MRRYYTCYRLLIIASNDPVDYHTVQSVALFIYRCGVYLINSGLFLRGLQMRVLQ